MQSWNGRQRRKFYVFSIIMIVITTLLLYTKFDFVYPFEETDRTEEVNFYLKSMQEQCGNKEETDLKLQYPTTISSHRPQCENLLKNLTRGAWVPKINASGKLAEHLDNAHTKYRQNAGIPLKPWRRDGKCGYNYLAPQITKWWPRVGSFCEPQGPTPCCTDRYKGLCVSIEGAGNCDCPGCVDTRKIKDALLSNWLPEDTRCKWNEYSSNQACAVLNKLSKPHSPAAIHFVGDSLLRNTFMGLATILTDHQPRGIYKKCVSKELRELCWGENLFLRIPCHNIAVGLSLDELEKSRDLCEGLRNFQAFHKGFGQPQQSGDFIKFMKGLHGKENTYVILGVGLHFSCNHEEVINKYLDPVLLNKPYWPQVIWVHPLSVGLLKPPGFISIQGDEIINVFAKNIELYLKQYGVPVVDFRSVTKNVLSYDGTHYGTGVNMMKAQVLLNYFAALKSSR